MLAIDDARMAEAPDALIALILTGAAARAALAPSVRAARVEPLVSLRID